MQPSCGVFFFSSRRRHTRFDCDWSSDVCSSDLALPFSGTLYDLLVQKNEAEPPPPAQLVGGIPEDLDALCVALLRRDPAGRPTAAEILRRLEGKAPIRSAAHLFHDISPPFVGRTAELRALHDA